MIVELVTARLLLRPQRSDDLRALYDLTADEQMRRFLSPDPPSLEDSYRRLMMVLGGWATLGYSNFVVIERESGDHVGSCGVFRMVRSLDDGSDEESDEAGWLVAQDRWGRGYAREAMTAALGWFDAAFGRPTVCMIVPGNIASERLAARLGFVPDREALHKGDRVMLYARNARGETT